MCVLAFAALDGLLAGDATNLVVNRSSILSDMLELYSNASVLNKRLSVTFAGEVGDDFGGLTKEVFTSFWQEAYKEYFVGENCLVPFLPLHRLRKDGQHFMAMGRALSHMVQLTKSVPCVLARSVYVQLAFGTPPEDNCLLQDLMSFVTSQECALLNKAMTNFTACSQRERDMLLAFYTTHDMHTMPRAADIQEQLLSIAYSVFVSKPAELYEKMRLGIPQCHREMFWSQLTLNDLNSLLLRQRPTCENVMQCLTAENEDLHADEHRAFYFLQQFILNLELEDLQHFLHFVTGSVDLPQTGIKVSFMRTGHIFVAHTCSNTLEVPVAFQSYQEFRRELRAVLQSPYSFDFTLA